MSSGEESSSQSVLPRPAVLPAMRGASECFPFLYGALRTACAPVLRSLFDLCVSGLEHLPPRGPFILAANHHNYLDGVLLGVAVPRPVAFLVMPRVFHASPVHPTLHRGIGSIRINIERPGPGAIRQALRVLADGRIVAIFPEGPFSREGRLVQGQPGAGLIALRSGAPVVPAAIRGTYEALRGRRFYLPRRVPLSVRFGPPIQVQRSWHRPVTHAEREAITRDIMEAIAALLEIPRARPIRTGRTKGADAS